VYDDLMVDPVRNLVVRGSRHIELSSREFDLLLILIRRPGQVFSREQLLDLIWGMDRPVSPGIIETYVSYLRRKIDSGETTRLIKTIRRTGYTMRRDGYI
jgi:DNA-binding response OmpR family regulator